MENEVYIYVTVISSLFTLVGLVFYNHNKFKYADVKHQHSLEYMTAKDQIDAKRFKRKQSAIQFSETPKEKTALGTVGGIASLAPLLKNLDGDQIAGLADMFLGGGRGGGEDEEGGSSMDMLLDFAEKNPEVVKGLLEGISGGLKRGAPKEQDYNSQV